MDNFSDDQKLILTFLESGPKGRDDFWDSEKFYDPIAGRGVYPRKDLSILKDNGVIEKYKDDRRVFWKLSEDYKVVKKEPETEPEKKGFLKKIFGGK